jgi:hypothetical protein
MPSTKQGGGYTLTFAKKNKDVEKLLAEKKEQGIKLTDYICDAVRAFENNKSSNSIDINALNIDIKELVKEQVAIALGKVNETQNEVSLESDLDDIDIDDD